MTQGGTKFFFSQIATLETGKFFREKKVLVGGKF
jgi:hypothetical protein